MPSDKYEIKERDQWLEVSIWIFRSWGGERKINGEVYKGPVYYLGSNDIAIKELNAKE